MKRTNTILLLESDNAVAGEITECLSNFGYSVLHHSCKSNLVTIILKEKPDLIVLDVRPGEEFKHVETAQLVYDNYQIPVMFLTSPESKGRIEKARCSVLHSFAFKPLQTKDLVACVELTLFRHSMECRLQESEKKYNELSNSIFQALVECDLKGRILSLNRHGLKMFGLTAGDIEKGVMLTDYVQNNTSGSILDVSRQSCFIDSGSLNREFILINKFNKKYFIDELLAPVYSNNKLSGYRGVLIDITNRKLKQNLCCTFNNLNHLYNRADADITEITEYIAKEMRVFMPGLETIYFEYAAEHSKSPVYSEEHEAPPCFNGYTKYVEITDRPLLLRGKEFESFNRKEEFHNPLNYNACWMGFPVNFNARPLGVFVLSSLTDRSALSAKNFEKLVDFFGSVNLFLEKVNCLKELKRSENLFKSLVNTMNEGLIKIDLDSTISFANNRLNELSGYNHEDVVGKKCQTFLQTQDLKWLGDIIENRRKGISSQYEMQIKVKSGDLKNFYVNGAPYRDEKGNIIGSIGTFTDISAKKEQFALFAATETLLREITNTIDVAFWIYSLETKSIQYLSPAFKLLFEVELEEIYEKNSLRKFIHPEDVKTVLEKKTANLSNGRGEIKYRIITPRGDIKWICDKSVVIKDQAGKAIKIIGYAQEITKLKLIEQRLIKGETEKEEIIRSIPDSFIVLNRKNEILNSYFKTDEKEFFHGKANRIQGKSIYEVVDKKIAETICGYAAQVLVSPKAIVFELEIPSNKSSQWFEVRMTSMGEEKTLMTIRNITSAKVNISNIQKLFNITEQTPDLVMITDVAGKIEYVNPMFVKLTGYEFQEIVGESCNILKSGRHNAGFYKDLWSILNAGQVFKADFYNKNKSGEIFIEEKIITPYRDINGEITNFISTGRDVTRERHDALKTSKHRHLERTLAIKQQKNRTFSLIQGHENERRKFAKEIHEGLSQMLSVAIMNLETISTNELINAEQRGKIEFVNNMVSGIMQELRGISTNLSPRGLFEFGLHAVVQQMVKQLNAKAGSPVISFRSNTRGLRFLEEIEINFYRIIQEALQNGLKHSDASKINMALNFKEGKLILLIKDNGIGINKRELEAKKKKLFGLSTLEERAAIMDAELEITTNKNKGFEINMAVKTKTMNA